MLEEVFQIGSLNYNLRNTREFKSHNVKLVSFGTESLAFLGSKIWDKLRIYLKFLNSLDGFRQNFKHCVRQDCPVDYAKTIFIMLVLFIPFI